MNFYYENNTIDYTIVKSLIIEIMMNDNNNYRNNTKVLTFSVQTASRVVTHL